MRIDIPDNVGQYPIEVVNSYDNSNINLSYSYNKGIAKIMIAVLFKDKCEMIFEYLSKTESVELARTLINDEIKIQEISDEIIRAYLYGDPFRVY